MSRILVILLLISRLAAQDLLTSAEEVARYPDNTSERQPKVSLEAVVTYIDPTGTVFLADVTGATFLSRVKSSSAFVSGQMISVKGTRFPGLFIGGIIPTRTEVIGTTPLPPPRSVNLRDLASGKFHYQLVVIEGIGRSIERIDETAVILNVSVPGGEVAVRFDQAPADLENLIDAKLKAVGLAAGGINDRRQLVSPYLKATSSEAVTILQAAEKNIPLLKAAGVSADHTGPSHRVSVRGSALSSSLEGFLSIRDETGALRLKTGQINITPGTEVIATGFPASDGFSPMLDDALVVETGKSEPIPPIAISENNIASGKLDSELVALEATLLSKNPYVVSAQGREIQIRPHHHKSEFPAPGSKLRLTGIWQVTGTSLTGYNSFPSSFSLRLRSADDIQVISAPPWWTKQRMTILLAFIASAGLIALAWASVLRIQVSKQVSLIEAKTQREAVTEERQRIAREFHDTLEQELAGLSIRLDAALPRVSDPAANGLLTQLRSLLLRMQTETRDFIHDLRETDPAPLEDSLRRLTEHLQSTTEIALDLELIAAPELPPHTRHHVLRIIREAVNNAIKHSKATAIQISITDTSIRILDNGEGFDTTIPHTTRFGLQGMQERAKKISALLEITSHPDQGTTIRIGLHPPPAD